MYVQPGASGGPVGHPVLVGDGAAHDVVAHGGGLVTFLGVLAGVAGVAMSKAVAMSQAVVRRVRSPPLVGVIAATPPPTTTPGLGRKLSQRVLTWSVRLELKLVREELEVMSCSKMAFSLEVALARLLRALSVESRRPGLKAVVWAESAWPR